MDSDRKYRQNGYMDSGENKNFREDRPKPQGPRPPLDVTGPRLPRLVQHVAASRCYNCATTLPPETDLNGNCPPTTIPLYRAYNNGMGGAPNHRYMISLTLLNQMIAAGWVFEGNPNNKVFACVPA